MNLLQVLSLSESAINFPEDPNDEVDLEAFWDQIEKEKVTNGFMKTGTTFCILFKQKSYNYRYQCNFKSFKNIHPPLL